MADLNSPEGIERRHIHDPGGSRLRGWPVGLIGLGLLLAASVLGIFGGEARITVASEAAELEVEGPTRIRNGEFFEMVFTIGVNESIDDLVLTVDADVWRDVTINTFIPAPAEESTRDGAFTFGFGPTEAGERLIVKVDGQINPDHAPAANEGAIAVADGDAMLATVEYRMEVLP